MARRRFFVDSIRSQRATLSGDDARHLRQVLRAEVGQRYEISDNRSVYLAEVEGFGHDQVRLRVVEELPISTAPARFTLLLALIKFDRFEWALEKATELGVERVVPVQAARSEKGLERAAAKRLERWRRIARESSQQARRAHIPEVAAPVLFEEALAMTGAWRCFLDERREAMPILAVLPDVRQVSDEVLLLAGPEGGWADSERGRALETGWVPVSLGPAILRSETAALAALAVVAAAWDTGGNHPMPVL